MMISLKKVLKNPLTGESMVFRPSPDRVIELKIEAEKIAKNESDVSKREHIFNDLLKKSETDLTLKHVLLVSLQKIPTDDVISAIENFSLAIKLCDSEEFDFSESQVQKLENLLQKTFSNQDENTLVVGQTCLMLRGQL